MKRRNGPQMRPAPTLDLRPDGSHSIDAQRSSARAIYLAPDGRRTWTAAFVQSCPRCGAGHVHRLPDGYGWRRPSCGARYWLAVDEQAVAA